MLANDWLADVYEAHYDAVFRQCLAHLRNRDEAADAAQDVFTKTAAFGTPREPGERSQAWLLTVARNHCIDLLRRRHRLTGALLRLEPGADPTADPERTTIDRHLVHAVLDPLTPRDRKLLWESAVERRPVREIASGLRLSYLATAQALRRARQRAGAIAARVATVFGIIGLRRGGSHLPPAREALLVAAVPLFVVTLQSSQAGPHGTAVAGTPTVARLPAPMAIRRTIRVSEQETVRLSASSVPQAKPSAQPSLEPAAALVSAAPIPSLKSAVGTPTVGLELPSKLPASSATACGVISAMQCEAALSAARFALSR